MEPPGDSGLKHAPSVELQSRDLSEQPTVGFANGSEQPSVRGHRIDDEREEEEGEEEEESSGRPSVVLGIIQIICGAVSVIAHSIGLGLALNSSGRVLYYTVSMLYLMYGYWCGLSFILAGAFVCIARVKGSRGFRVASMLMSIIAAIFAGVQTLIAILANIRAPMPHQETSDEWGILAASYILLVFGLAAFVMSIWSSVLSCRSICCRSQKPGDASRYDLMGQPAPVRVVYEPVD